MSGSNLVLIAEHFCARAPCWGCGGEDENGSVVGGVVGVHAAKVFATGLKSKPHCQQPPPQLAAPVRCFPYSRVRVLQNPTRPSAFHAIHSGSSASTSSGTVPANAAPRPAQRVVSPSKGGPVRHPRRHEGLKGALHSPGCTNTRPNRSRRRHGPAIGIHPRAILQCNRGSWETSDGAMTAQPVVGPNGHAGERVEGALRSVTAASLRVATWVNASLNP